MKIFMYMLVTFAILTVGSYLSFVLISLEHYAVYVLLVAIMCTCIMFIIHLYGQKDREENEELQENMNNLQEHLNTLLKQLKSH